MPDDPLYLDHAATTPLLPQALEAMAGAFQFWANPSSPHRAGRAARSALEDARARIAQALNWNGEVIFTSGASEALAIALARCKLPVAAVSAVEHDAVLRHTAGARLPVNGAGLVDPDAAALPGLVAIQQVNSETGVIQPLGEVGRAIRDAGGLLLADCAQGAGKLPLPDADMIALAAHKFGGPIGIGALLVRDWAMLEPTGGQERGYRAGTENLPGVLAMLAALEAGTDWLCAAADLRTLLDSELIAAGGHIIAQEAPRIASIGSYRMPGVSSAAQLIRFDAMGIAVSAGSACSSGSLRPSHVLKAMGLDDEAAAQVVRVSIGRETTAADIRRFVDAWTGMAGKTRVAA